MAYETQSWPLIRARWDGGKRTGNVDLIVMHTMETDQGPSVAEMIGKDFAARPADNKASSHVGVDSDSIVQYVPDSYVAYAAPGANSNGMQIELAGRAGMTRKQWLEPRALAVLVLGADVAAQYAHKYSIPLVQLTNAELRAGGRGFIGHVQASEVFKKSDHTDPGTGFPWDLFLAMVRALFAERA